MESTEIAITMLLFFNILHVGFLLHGSAATSGANDTDYLALLSVKSKISDDPQGVMSSWNDTLHFCEWEGVTCGRRHRRVTALDLPSRGLVGSLSPYLGNMSFLTQIVFDNNTLGGVIPPEIGRLFRLQLLRLGSNSFQGEIPTNLSSCKHLTVLALHYNQLVGKFPNQLTSLLKLKVLWIHNNNLSGGGIPPSIGNLTFLESLSLGGCGSGGSIPNVFHKMTSLTELGLGGNNLNGTIPSSIYNLSLLEIFSFGQNYLTGILPTSLGLMLPHLRMLELGENNFTGILPPSISNCSDLDTFSVTKNQFHGKVDINFGNLQNLITVFMYANNLGSGEKDEMKFISSLSNCSNLITLDFGYNKFRGMLPNLLGNFSDQFLGFYLGQNHLYGTIPSSLANLFSLTSLDLGVNQFTGTIPITIGKLQNLQVLYLDENNLLGSIPDSIGNLSLLSELTLSHNQLEGTIPSSLGNCHKLQYLSLEHNKLSGRIPRQILQLSSLSIGLDLGRNHLSGPIPVEVGGLKNLGQLSLQENNLSGELPNTLGNCIVLELLDLGGNFFQGSITSLGSMRSLLHVNLSRNNFSGLIPRFFEKIPLENLDISFNNFEGEVPMKGVFANSSAISVEGNHKLCGGMRTLELPKCNLKDTSKRPQRVSVALKVVISTASALLGLAIVLFLLFRWFTKKGNEQPSGLVVREPLMLKVSYENLLKATNGFSLENLIGVGAFASVYKGVLNEDGLIVAVKVLNLQRRGGSKSFVKECDALRHVRHRNLIKVITCCSSVDFQGNDFKALVYEFMPNGSLDQWLHSSPSASPRLDLLQRISIAIDVACGLEYLHHNSDLPIVHCDLKPSNILLDRDMVARVGDFGLAKLLHPENTNAITSCTSGIKGTIGYTPPEYGVGNEVSTKGDVYSYGILLLEMVIGKSPTDSLFQEQEGLNLHKYASSGIANSELEIVEPMILNGNNEECLISMLKIGVACSLESPQERMDIRLVIQELNTLKGTIISDKDCISN